MPEHVAEVTGIDRRVAHDVTLDEPKSDEVNEALGSGDHANTALFAFAPDLLEQAIQLVVATARVVMEQRERLHLALGGHPQCVLESAVAPRRLLGEFVRRVLRIVDEEISPLAEFARTIGDEFREESPMKLMPTQ